LISSALSVMSTLHVVLRPAPAAPTLPLVTFEPARALPCQYENEYFTEEQENTTLAPV